MRETSQTMNDTGGLGCLGPYVAPPGDQDDLWRDYAAGALAGHRGRAANFPDFMLIGGPRSGTTWLYDALARHPKLFTNGQKEFRHFSVNWIEKSLESYMDLFKGQGAMVKGDLTPGYGLLPRRAIEVIHGLNPDLKLIYAMRNPVLHAWSLTKHMLNHRAFTFADLDRTGEISLEMLIGFFVSDFAIANSDHASVLERWMSVFPKENFYAYFSDDLRQDPVRVLDEIQQFLGLSPAMEASLMMPESLVKTGLDGSLDGFLKRFLTTLWQARTARLEKFLDQNFGRSLPGAWARQMGEDIADEDFLIHDGPGGRRFFMSGGRQFGGLFYDGASTDAVTFWPYLFDMFVDGEAGGPGAKESPWNDARDMRQARIVRHMNAELFLKPVAGD